MQHTESVVRLNAGFMQLLEKQIGEREIVACGIIGICVKIYSMLQ